MTLPQLNDGPAQRLCLVTPLLTRPLSYDWHNFSPRPYQLRVPGQIGLPSQAQGGRGVGVGSCTLISH